jgi:anti-anti-sigma regulatory factor
LPYTPAILGTNQNTNEPGSIRLKEISSEEIEVIPEGHLSREDMNEFQIWLDRALQGGHRIIALNFQGVNNLSSSAIGKILHFKRACDEMGRRLVIRHCGAQMLQLLKMIKFDALIQIES